MTVWIITIGDELISGLRADTNSAWLARQLAAEGFAVGRTLSVGDDREAIMEVTALALERADVTLLSGGLGPTHDDRTKEALSGLLAAPLVTCPEVEQAVRRFFRERGRIAGRLNLDQALVPAGLEWHINPCGTAPGLLVRRPDRLLFALPGVPEEMKALYREWVAPTLISHFGPGPSIVVRWFRTTGIGESDLFERIGGLEDLGPVGRLAYLPAPEGVTLYATASAGTPLEAERWLQAAGERIRTGAGDYLVSEAEQGAAERVAALLIERGHDLSVAESCTGGALAAALVDVPGASAWFRQGWVVYADQAKVEELGVPADLLVQQGAVSEQVAGAMARGARRKAGSTWALAVTGVAGPGGGNEQKPVGTVCIACDGPGGTRVNTLGLGPLGRAIVRRRSVAAALDLLRRILEGLDTGRGGWRTPR